ncbi:MAG: hypothetical protein OEY97_10905 [Nitrospirota bacterium]|nr:hypothetical protein [Nitrospirota bacterium]
MLLAFLLLVAAPWGGIALAAEDGCAGCHDGLKSGAMAGRHADYRGSVHERAGVGCDSCHGGNPRAADKVDAHKGVMPAADKTSRIHFQNVPETCGACHKGQRRGFVTSRHYRELESTGQGPNCVTCHGSMATRVMGVDTIEQFCIVCHNPKRGIAPEKPWEAATALTLMDQADTLTRWAGEFAELAGKKPPPALDTARRELAAARTVWHTFDLEQVRAHARKASAAAVEAREALR